MAICSSNPDHGFQFPGDFEISAMGAADAGLEVAVPRALEAAGLNVIPGSLSLKPSSAGRYVSVRVQFHAGSRGDHDRAHQVLRALDAVKWTL
jgi:putative lipoic acid-binding regulatory protein